jgi:2-oxoisovalerate dehydrogenase E1 component alpha subunit
MRAHGFGLPSLRVDGNDYLAVRAAAEWAVDRARRGLGPTLVEWVTYRVGAHSSSDDPSGYRATDEPSAWPLGDPIARLRDHLVRLRVWTDEDHEQLLQEVKDEVRAAQVAAEAHGTLQSGPGPSPKDIFDGVFKEMPPHLRRQRQQAGY